MFKGLANVPANAIVSELPMDPKIRLYAGGARSVRGYGEMFTEKNAEEGNKDCVAMVPYRELLGGLLWVSQGTRPDIAYAVSQCAKYSTKPKSSATGDPSYCVCIVYVFSIDARFSGC